MYSGCFSELVFQNLVFGDGFNISLSKDFSLKCRLPNFCRNDGLHPIGKGE